MAATPVAAATTAALRRHFGPVQTVDEFPSHVAVRTVDRRGDQPKEHLWVSTRFGRGSRLSPVVEQDLLDRLGFEWVAIRPSPEFPSAELERDVLRLLDRTPAGHNYLSLVVLDDSTKRLRLDNRSTLKPRRAITPFRVRRVWTRSSPAA